MTCFVTISYHVDSIEEAFHLAFELKLSFNRIFIFKAREQCSKYEGYRQYNYQYPSNNRHVNIVSSDDVDDSRVVEKSMLLPKLLVMLRIY